MKESTARIGDGRTDGRTLTTGLEVNAFRAVGRKSKTCRNGKSLFELFRQLRVIHTNSSVSYELSTRTLPSVTSYPPLNFISSTQFYYNIKVTFAPISIFGNHQKKLYKSKLYFKLSKF